MYENRDSRTPPIFWNGGEGKCRRRGGGEAMVRELIESLGGRGGDDGDGGTGKGGWGLGIIVNLFKRKVFR